MIGCASAGDARLVSFTGTADDGSATDPAGQPQTGNGYRSLASACNVIIFHTRLLVVGINTDADQGCEVSENQDVVDQCHGISLV
jgi:hypothetical protein